MITLIIIIALYVLGCVLAYGRLNAIKKEDMEVYGLVFNYPERSLIFTSWLCFIILVFVYIVNDDKYFLKF